MATTRKTIDGQLVNDASATPGVVHLTLPESVAFFEAQARQLLGISGEEFLRRYDAGEYDAMLDLPEHSDIIYLAMLSDVVR